MDERMERHVDLTAAEREVLGLLAKGFSDDELAERLTMTVAGVRSRLQRFYDRAGLHGREVVAWAARHDECCCRDSPRRA